jgi:hypothetical protein
VSAACDDEASGKVQSFQSIACFGAGGIALPYRDKIISRLGYMP